MILLSVRDVSRQFDAEPVFSGVTFDVRSGEKIGLVGPNGAGKTTLLNVLIGEDDPDTGVVQRQAGAEVALLRQAPVISSETSLREEVRQGLSELYQLQEEAVDLAEEIAVEQNAATQRTLQRRYDRIQQELHSRNAYNIDHRVDEVLQGLGFQADNFDRPLTQFSGGEQNRAALARLLLRAPGVLLLDEPTNHLDIQATEWLEDYLVKCQQAVILVSHDRYFLDRVTTRILELNRGAVDDYPGNFSHYWAQREERNKVRQRTYAKQQEFIAKTTDFIRRNKAGQKYKQAADREKKLERLDRITPPQDFTTFSMAFGEPTRTGDWVIDAVGLSKGFGEPLFTDFTLRLNRGDRVGILGPNGSGKTTLLKTLLGELSPDTGTVRQGTGVKIGYFDQQLASVDPKRDAVEAIRPAEFPHVTPGELRNLLARFGIRGEMAFQTVGSMSGGEKSKVALAKIAARNVNLLVLDEPTNHLDLWARDSLEQTLREFDGTLLFVSHDRYFLDRVATNVIVLGGERWRFHEGNYSNFVRFDENRNRELAEMKVASANASLRTETDSANSQAAAELPGQNRERPKRRFPYRKVSEIEAEIDAQETLLKQLEASLADPEIHRDGDRLQETTAAFEETTESLQELYAHWDEATELN